MAPEDGLPSVDIRTLLVTNDGYVRFEELDASTLAASVIEGAVDGPVLRITSAGMRGLFSGRLTLRETIAPAPSEGSALCWAGRSWGRWYHSEAERTEDGGLVASVGGRRETKFLVLVRAQGRCGALNGEW